MQLSYFCWFKSSDFSVKKTFLQFVNA